MVTSASHSSASLNWRRRGGTRWVVLSAAIVGAAVVSAGGARAADSQTFHGVTAAMFDCIKATSIAEHGTVYAPANAIAGSATTSSSLWQVVVDFALDPATGDLTYTLVRKTWIVPAGTMWDGLAATVRGCGGA